MKKIKPLPKKKIRKLNKKKVLICLLIPIVVIMAFSTTGTKPTMSTSEIIAEENLVKNEIVISTEVATVQEPIAQELSIETISDPIPEPIVEEPKIKTTPVEPQKVYATTGLNIRDLPGTDGNIIDTVSLNTELIKVGTVDNGWVQLEQGYVNGKYLSNEKKVIQVAQVTSRGSETPRKSSSPTGEYLGKYKLTYYCACSKCCGKSTGLTASGARATAGVTIAAPSNFAFGTKLSIDGHTYIVQDRGGAIKGNKIDVFVGSHSEALNKGTRQADVYLVQ